MMKQLYFVRHGLSVMNQQGIFSGRTDTPLTLEGKRQSQTAGEQLKDAGISCIVASPTKRTMDTAKIIAKQIGFPADKIITSDLIVERDFGPMEGTAYSTKANLDDTAGVEHSTSLIERSRQGLEFLQSLDADVILVVSHGAVGRALEHLLHPDTPYRATQKFGNAEVIQLLP